MRVYIIITAHATDDPWARDESVAAVYADRAEAEAALAAGKAAVEAAQAKAAEYDKRLDALLGAAGLERYGLQSARHVELSEQAHAEVCPHETWRLAHLGAWPVRVEVHEVIGGGCV